MYAGNGDYSIHFIFPVRIKTAEWISGVGSEPRLKFIFGVCGAHFCELVLFADGGGHVWYLSSAAAGVALCASRRR